MKGNILIVYDNLEIAGMLEIYLKSEQFCVFKTGSVSEARSCILKEQIDLAVLNESLPDGSGLTFCKRVKEKYQIPVLMLLSADTNPKKAVMAEADDYIRKPFRPGELTNWIKGRLRQLAGNTLQNKGSRKGSLFVSGLELNLKTHECIQNELNIFLEPVEFAILKTLCEKKGTVVSVEKLAQAVSQVQKGVGSNEVITYIRHLREKLQDSVNKPRYIRTVWGVGYKIDG